MNMNAPSSHPPVLVTPVNIIRAHEIDSFSKVHMDFVLIVIVFLFVIIGVSRFESSLPERTQPNQRRSKELSRGSA